MAERRFLDTNILLYAISRYAGDADKKSIARSLILDTPCALSVQVCQEFVSKATHPKHGFRLTIEEAVATLEPLRRFPIQDTTLAIFDAAVAIKARTGYSIWDSLIVAAAQALGCNTLYTEDMQDGRIIDGLRIINPFREGAVLP